jgi:hypothetical protein
MVHIFFINLEHRQDRRDQITAHLAEYGMNNIAERFPAIAHPFAALGCIQAHVACLKLAKDRGYPCTFILEDDFEWLCSPEECRDYMNKLPAEFDVFLLTPKIIRGEILPEEPLWIRVREAQNACGYIVRQHYYETLIRLFEYSAHFLEQTLVHHKYATDQIWKRLQAADRWYCFMRRVAHQRAGWSDISSGYVVYE